MSPASLDLLDPTLPPATPSPRSGPILAVLAIFSLDRIFVASLCVASIGFFAIAYSISLKDPDYFSRRMISSLPTSELDPIMTGAIVDGGGDAMPAPRIVRATPLVAADYQIVMVFGSEAILSTSEELWRVKVGSMVPGLGEVLQIEPTDTGGTVRASQATLRSVAR